MTVTDPVTILLSIIICLGLVKVFYGRKRNIYRNFPPGPSPLPLIGNINILNLKKPFKTFIELSKQYGSVFSIQVGPQKMVVLCGYETVKDALVNYAEEFSERPVIPIFLKTSNRYGVVFSHGKNWKVMRRFTISTLRDFGMGKKSLEYKINEECNFLVQMFNSYGGKPFENYTIMNAAVANIIISILLGHRFEYDNSTFLRLMKLINQNVELLGSPTVLLYNNYPSLMDWLPGCHKTILKNTEELINFMQETFTKSKDQLDLNDKRNFIDAFLFKQKQEKSSSEPYFHDENLIRLMIDLFAAGMETTASTLRWSLLLMMKNPEIQKNVQKEIERVIGSAEPKIEHRKEMPYTDAVIHEVQRFGNILPANLPHETVQDVSFRGYFLPKGTYVIPLLASVLTDKNYFEKPDEFYPQHFLDSEGHFVKNEAFMPFSAGKRSCVGENLAKMELFLFFTRLLQSFTFQAPPEADLDLTPADGFTSAPRLYYMRALPRT